MRQRSSYLANKATLCKTAFYALANYINLPRRTSIKEI
jgi:hypothetical protein